jgi:hypothetical protein
MSILDVDPREDPKVQARAERYRRLAEDMRAASENLKHPSSRQGLRHMAESYEMMASQLERGGNRWPAVDD